INIRSSQQTTENGGQLSWPSPQRSVRPSWSRPQVVLGPTPPRYMVDANAKHDRHAWLVMGEGCCGWLPPHGVSLKQTLGYPARVFILRCVRKLLIMSGDDHAHPVAVGVELVDLDTDERILSHPFDFLSE